METRTSGKIIERVGKTAGGDFFDLVEDRRYMYPVIAAKEDCIVLRTTGKVKRTGEEAGP